MKKTSKIILCLFVFFLFIPFAALGLYRFFGESVHKVKMPVEWMTQELPLKDFSSVLVHDRWDATITQSEEFLVVLRISESIIEDSLVRVHGDTLILGLNKGLWPMGDYSKAVIAMPNIRNLKVANYGKAVVQGFQLPSLKINAANRSNVELEGNTIAYMEVSCFSKAKMAGQSNIINHLIYLGKSNSQCQMQKSDIKNACVILQNNSQLHLQMAGGVLKGNIEGRSWLGAKGQVCGKEIIASSASEFKSPLLREVSVITECPEALKTCNDMNSKDLLEYLTH